MRITNVKSMNANIFKIAIVLLVIGSMVFAAYGEQCAKSCCVQNGGDWNSGGCELDSDNDYYNYAQCYSQCNNSYEAVGEDLGCCAPAFALAALGAFAFISQRK